MKKVFIDGKAGTTGLSIYERLEKRTDIEIITLSDDLRKDENRRKEAMNSSDLTFLCLPDEAARQAVLTAENPNTVIIDASTAHRTCNGWEYGLPEVFDGGFESIKKAKRIAVPGCHASGFTVLVKPLRDGGIIKEDVRLTCVSLTGYSGGGNAMISEYEGENKSAFLNAPRQYALTQNHKHLKEMTVINNLKIAPVFMPIVSDFYSGMLVTISLFKEDLDIGCDINTIKKLYQSKYNGKIIFYKETLDESGFIPADMFSGKDFMAVTVNGNGDRITLGAVFDNLGKGASGAAVECMNIVFGLSPEHSLIL
ncbi:MAG: N-acetyl-gamma-glutamyl-phosphate reductase [Clostridiales bacterium]|jgi:N-acetyl-gamma-glutamyl-phosphate reductase|nr:N-acetyl-gamma-glutamyl-phosphate reductase [Clostridiales bacterium]